MLRCFQRWFLQVYDPLRTIRGLRGYPRYLSTLYRYARLPGAEAVRLKDTDPQIHDNTQVTPFDAHYFYVNGWGIRGILRNKPQRHVDIGSQVIFANMLSAVLPVTFMDYRPLQAKLPGLDCVGGSILAMPFADNSIESLSCLHVIEHIGLGRYGDLLDPQGTRKAARELLRVLAPQGDLFVGVPVGKPKLSFNAHRIHAPEAVREMFAPLELVEFSGVHDDGAFVERVDLAEFKESEYACGMYWFRKPE